MNTCLVAATTSYFPSGCPRGCSLEGASGRNGWKHRCSFGLTNYFDLIVAYSKLLRHSIYL